MYSYDSAHSTFTFENPDKSGEVMAPTQNVLEVEDSIVDADSK